MLILLISRRGWGRFMVEGCIGYRFLILRNLWLRWPRGLSGRMLMDHKDALGQIVFTSHAWRRLLEVRGPLVHELILKFHSTFRFGETAESARQIPDKGDLSAYWIGISSEGDFLGTTPSYTVIRDLMLRLCHRLIACIIARSQAPEKVIVTDLFYLQSMDVDSINIPYLLAQYLRRFDSGSEGYQTYNHR
nr:hypothetical protein [Tanacetum cinerariifolium]